MYNTIPVYRIAETFEGENFRVFRGFVKVFSAKFCNPQCTRCVYAGALRMREGHTYIIIGPEQSAKVFSAKFSFCTEKNEKKVFSLEKFPLYGIIYI